MQKLNFNSFSFRLKSNNNKTFIFDEIRKKFVILHPEEWVRQHLVRFLIEKGYPKSYINVEKKITVNGLARRYDIVVFAPDGSIFLIVECKAPSLEITQKTFDQIARYNTEIHAEYIMVSNGLTHYFCRIDYQNGKYVFLEDLPPYL